VMIAQEGIPWGDEGFGANKGTSQGRGSICE